MPWVMTRVFLSMRMLTYGSPGILTTVTSLKDPQAPPVMFY